MGLIINNKFLTRRIARKKESLTSDNSASNTNPIPKGNWIIIVIGIVIASIGFVGAIFYGSQVVKDLNAGVTSPTNPPHIKDVLPIDLEIVFIVTGVIGFGILTYGFVTRVNKPLDFYPI